MNMMLEINPGAEGVGSMHKNHIHVTIWSDPLTIPL